MPPRKNQKSSPKTPSKRVGSSASSSIPSLEAPEEIADAFQKAAVGHVPRRDLSPQDASLIRIFQSNFLSLISHELRTPLMGVLNALTLLEEAESEGALGGVTRSEMLGMARRNADRLQQALITLLDLAALESGTYYVRLREVELGKLVRSRIPALARQMEMRELKLKERELVKAVVILGDPQKLSRAIDLCLEVICARARQGSPLELTVGMSELVLSFELAPEGVDAWDQAWVEALAGSEAGIGAPGSAFAGVMRSEQDFLTRIEEGLGSEFLLIHEILRLHRGKFAAERESSGRVTLRLEWPELSSEEALRAVLTSRAYEVSTELATVALALIQVPSGRKAGEFCRELKAHLFRSTDAAYALPEAERVAVVLDDCRPGDAPGILKRLEKALGQPLKSSFAHCPEDTQDPAGLFEIAEKRLEMK